MTENTAGRQAYDVRAPENAGEAAPRTDEDRLRRLENQVQTLAEAVRVLARGLAGGPVQVGGEERAARGARLAHELLLSQGL